MTRRGFPIQDHAIQNSVNPQIAYAQRFEEFEACVAAGLDLYKWNNFEYPNEFKADVIAWHQLHNLVKINAEDAVQRKVKKKK